MNSPAGWRVEVVDGFFAVACPFTGRERYRTILVLESGKARGLGPCSTFAFAETGIGSGWLV